MTTPLTAKELAEYIPTDAFNLRNQLKDANGQINFDQSTDALSLEQLKVWLPRYLQGRGQLKGEKRQRVEALLDKITATQMPNEFLIANEKTPKREQSKTKQTPTEQLQSKIDELTNEKKNLQSIIDQWKEKPVLLRVLGNPNASAFLALLLAGFELVGTYSLLAPTKGIALAIPVAVSMSFALLVFTANQNRFGQWFCIAFAFLLGALYFELLPSYLTNWLFAFVPPTVAAILVNSLNQEK